MIKIALTGGIGTGKTYLSKHFKDMGIPVFYADEEAKKLYSELDFLKQLHERFPDEAIWKLDGSLDISKLRRAFEDEHFLLALSNFVHPYVMKKFDQWCTGQDSQAVMMESAIIFEYNLEKYFDKIIVADAPEELRIKRIKLRNPELSEDEIKVRMQKQMSQEEKCCKADLVVCTGETYMSKKNVLSQRKEKR